MKNSKIEVKTAKSMGFCFGVKNALDRIKDANCSRRKYMLGQLIHNSSVINQLEKEGITIVEDINELKDGAVVISAHGVPDSLIECAKKKGLEIIDTTCPLVKNVHNITKNLEKDGCKVIIFGDKKHTEVKGIVGNLKNAIVVNSIKCLLKNIDNDKKTGIVFQTTQDIGVLSKIKIMMRGKKNVIIKDTICSATKLRQSSSREVADSVELMIVIGSYNSANTKRLFQICSKITETKHIESANEIKKGWLKGKKSIGITAGASTPDFVIEDCINKLNDIISGT